MMFKRSKEAKPVDSEWHEMRAKARVETFGISEWSEQDVVKYDLDTARITGADTRRNYLINRPLDDGEGQMDNGTDLRTLDSR